MADSGHRRLTREPALFESREDSTRNVDAAGATRQISLTLTNKGIGPARIEGMELSYDGKHMANADAFLKTCASLVKPGGLLFVATLNRTLKAHALAIVGAEYILRWVPRGTHDWRKFLTPEEIAGFLAATPLEPQAPVGVSYNPLNQQWRLSGDASVNYMVVANYPASAAF